MYINGFVSVQYVMGAIPYDEWYMSKGLGTLF